jgi:hypothetical protein
MFIYVGWYAKYTSFYEAHQMKSIPFEKFLNLVNFDAFLPTLVCHCCILWNLNTCNIPTSHTYIKQTIIHPKNDNLKSM